MPRKPSEATLQRQREQAEFEEEHKEIGTTLDGSAGFRVYGDGARGVELQLWYGGNEFGGFDTSIRLMFDPAAAHVLAKALEAAATKHAVERVKREERVAQFKASGAAEARPRKGKARR